MKNNQITTNPTKKPFAITLAQGGKK